MNRATYMWRVFKFLIDWLILFDLDVICICWGKHSWHEFYLSDCVEYASANCLMQRHSCSRHQSMMMLRDGSRWSVRQWEYVVRRVWDVLCLGDHWQSVSKLESFLDWGDLLCLGGSGAGRQFNRSKFWCGSVLCLLTGLYCCHLCYVSCLSSHWCWQ